MKAINHICCLNKLKGSLVLTFLFLIVLTVGTASAQELNTLLAKLNTAPNDADRIILLQEVGIYYQKQAAYAKAIDYFQQSLDLIKNKKMDEKKSIFVREQIAQSHIQLKEYPKAIAQYEVLLGYYQRQNDAKGKTATMHQLARLHQLNKDHDAALNYTQQILQVAKNSNDPIEVVKTYNNLGYLYGATGNSSQSLDNYLLAINNSKQSTKSNALSADQEATLLTNTGTSYTYMGDYKTASQYFYNALGIYQKEGNSAKQAQTYNYIAANEYISARNELAIENALKAVDIAKPINNYPVLIESYQILAEAYQQEGDFKEAQKYLKLLQELKDKQAELDRKVQRKALEEQIEIEKKENELNQLMAEKDRQASALKQSELERQKQEQDLKLKENELNILRKNQELQAAAIRNQQLEKDRVQQLLEITRQKSLAESQKAEAERQKLLAEKERAEKQQEQQAREATEVKNKAQEEQLAAEKSIRQYSYYLFALIGLVLLLVVVSLISSRRAAKKLKIKSMQIQEQKEEILTQNEELRQTQEELETQRDFLDHQNVQLDQQNKRIQSSISAAVSIQRAVLPYKAKMDTILKDYFVMFRPKDVVSGDFYWLNGEDNENVLLVADCTGHGVPGAFMTLIGNTLMDKIVRVWKVKEPAEILVRLHEEIRTILRQDETQNNNGMDANILAWAAQQNGDQITMEWAGAKHTLYYVTPQEGKAQMVRGNRKSIGGLQNHKISFENHTLSFPKGTMIYLGSDGLTDQNDTSRRKFSEKKLVSLIEEIYQKDLSEQKEILEKELDNHMIGTNQRDDILWMGFRV